MSIRVADGLESPCGSLQATGNTGRIRARVSGGDSTALAERLRYFLWSRGSGIESVLEGSAFRARPEGTDAEIDPAGRRLGEPQPGVHRRCTLSSSLMRWVYASGTNRNVQNLAGETRSVSTA